MDYDTACDTTFTKAQAKREVDAHDGDGWEAFLTDCGDHETYLGQTVLDWLGY